MKILIYSRQNAENAVKSGNFPQNAAVISFYDPHTEHIDYSLTNCDTYYCPIEDIDVWSDEEYAAQSSKFDYADDLADFIYEAFHSGKDIICQCDYGQSRSAGCAAAIAQHFYGSGIDIFTDLNKSPNKFIYHKVIAALEERKNDQR